MTPPPYLLVWDHGTTSVKALLMDRQGQIRARSDAAVEPIYPRPGWVEQDAAALWALTLPLAQEALKQAGVSWEDIAAIGITNQRETTILWDRETGRPVYNAIVWQCRRTADRCEELRRRGHEPLIRERTGLIADPYFSASKIAWLLENVPETAFLLQQGRLLFGTVDTWILWHLSGGRVHGTDPSNASRTLLYDIHRQRWDPELLALFGVPESLLPEVRPSAGVFGETDPRLTGGRSIPLAGNAGDQQAALYGQKCWEPGTAKSTYGTGAFIMMNLGASVENPSVASRGGLLTTLACNRDGQPCYALEGAIFTAGATIEWLIRALGLAENPAEAAQLAGSLADTGADTGGVYLVPAFSGLAAPHWDPAARGLICGLTQGSGRAHLIRAAYEAMAYQTRDVLEAMQQDAMKRETRLDLAVLRVDGGVTRCDFLMQFLADLLALPVLRIDDVDLTAKGVGYLAGLTTGFWASPDDIRGLPETGVRFEPKLSEAKRQSLYDGWRQAMEKALTGKSPLPV